MIEIKGKYSTAKIFAKTIDETSITQIKQMVEHPAFTEQIRIMPDVHAGAANTVIGFTMPLSNFVIPNTVGVDIGCGMLATKIDLYAEDVNFRELDKKIRSAVPIGNHKNKVHSKPICNPQKDFPYQKATDILYFFSKNYFKKFSKKISEIDYDYNFFKNLCKKIDGEQDYIECSLGTLGGGNHFIEIGIDSRDKKLWLTIHTGSRHFGKLIADYHSKVAKKTCNAPVPKGMEFLKDKEMFNYFVDMIFAQVYASYNRHLITQNILKILKKEPLEQIESVHNYIDFEDMIIRKGAIRSYKNNKMIIPFNMADGILICEGKSNPQWNFSAPHGAGRLMSRNKAFENLNLSDYKKIMEEKGIFTTSVNKNTLDEAPMAYKNPKEIEEQIEPTAQILFKIKPVYNLKSE